MKRRTNWAVVWALLVIAWLLVGFFGKAAHAGEMQQDVVMAFEPGTLAEGVRMPDEMVLQYLQYVADLTRYNKFEIVKVPKVIIVEPEEFVHEFCDNKDCAAHLLGVFVFADSNAVYIRANADKLWYVSLGSVIVHELTHLVAFASGDFGGMNPSCGDQAIGEIEARTAGYLYDHMIMHRDYPFTMKQDIFTECAQSIAPTQKARPGEKIGVVEDPTIWKPVAPTE